MLWILSGLLLGIWVQWQLQESCYLCGWNRNGLKAVREDRKEPVLLRMNLWEVTGLGPDRTDHEKDGGQNGIRISVRGEGYGMLLVMPEAGGCRFELTPGKRDVLDMELAAERLCGRCYQQLEEWREQYGENMWDVFLAEPGREGILPLCTDVYREREEYSIRVTADKNQIRGEVVYPGQREEKQRKQ